MSALVLASGSPQRRAILQTLAVEHRVRVPHVDEGTEGEPVRVAVQNAVLKARAVAADEPAGTFVLGSDTVIVDGSDGGPPRAVGKPEDAAGAAGMLRRWSGSGHHVASAAAVVRSAGPGAEPSTLLAEADTTLVRFRVLTADDVDWYVGTEEWRGRAGGYAIQLRGSLLVEGIEGDWWTVVGLPVALLSRRTPYLLR
ncbi:nucleoside triphosphate pyrophosphatase [Patulibacter sp.]|uniref:Maf family protein n=1 Tax=Patulibacter sp. TaxID=1912859 RepID=UPI002720FCCA|nr:Maf family protein [Patulibacter sp.]MDO9408433.1 Maf family protein [Patulibacter sp.]